MERSSFGKQREDRYFEDYIPGSVYRFGPAQVAEDEMIAFARRYDPQVFHTDPEGARKSAVGTLTASGWFTAVLAMRLLVDHYLPGANLGSPGIDELRWTKPVYPGDKLSVRVSIVSTRRSRSKPDRGIVYAVIEVLNQRDEVVMTWKGMTNVRCRDRSDQPSD
jgi:acyl dehydratase